MAIPQAAPASADANSGGGDFVSFATGTRVLDTRSGVGVAGTAKLGTGVEKSFQVLGVGAVPTTGVSAVMATVAILSPTVPTLFKVWPDGTAQPVDSVQHSTTANPNLSNTEVVPVGSNGKLRIVNTGGQAHAVIDIQGYFTTTTAAGGTGGFVPITQSRVVDTRSNLGTTGGAIAPGGTRTVTLATAGVPSNATAVYINLLIPSATTNGSMALAPGTATTGGSVFNYTEGYSSSGMSVKLSAGKATLRNSAGATAASVVIDIQGYFSPTATTGAGYRPALGRLIDTRTTPNRLVAGATLDVQVGGAAGLPVQGVAGALLNIHSSKTTAGNLAVTAWPTGTTRPNTSVNNNPGQTSRASLNIIKPGTDGKVSIKNLSDTDTDVYVEIEGWFADPLPPVAIEQNSQQRRGRRGGRADPGRAADAHPGPARCTHEVHVLQERRSGDRHRPQRSEDQLHLRRAGPEGDRDRGLGCLPERRGDDVLVRRDVADDVDDRAGHHRPDHAVRDASAQDGLQL